jgi:hypothetical protein
MGFMEDAVGDQVISGLKELFIRLRDGLLRGWQGSDGLLSVPAWEGFIATGIRIGLRRKIRWGECKYIDSGQPSE